MINFAKLALQKMSEGVTSDNYGAFIYTYKTKECPNGKLNAMGWMNYTIGYIMYVRQNRKKEAFPYIYQSTQIGCNTKKSPEPFSLIGDWYFDEFNNLEKSRTEKLKAANGQETDETKSILETQKDYITKAKDAYSTAYKITSNSPKYSVEYKNKLYSKMRKMFEFK